MRTKIIIFFVLFVGCVKTYSQEKSRSAKTGKYVTREYAEKHKSTTYTSKTKSKK